jgi:hypothetical protein
MALIALASAEPGEAPIGAVVDGRDKPGHDVVNCSVTVDL